MNKFSEDYHLYKILLETDLTTSQRSDLMLSEDLKGIMSGLKTLLKGGLLNTLKKLGGDATQIFQDQEKAQQLGTSRNAIKGEVEKLKNLTPKGVDQRAFVSAILNSYFDSYGIKPEEIANPKSISTSEKDASEKSKVKGGTPSGKSVKVGTPEATVTAAAAAAELSQQDVENAIENAKDMDGKKVMFTLSKIVADKAGVDSKLTSQVLSALFSQGVVVAENYQNIKQLINEIVYYDRWQNLAGLNDKNNHLTEKASVMSKGDTLHALIQSMKSGSAKDLQKMTQALSKLTPAERRDLENKDNRKKLATALSVNTGKDEKKARQIIDDIIQGKSPAPSKIEPSSDKKNDQTLDKSTAKDSDKSTGPVKDKKAQKDTKAKFGGTFDMIIKKFPDANPDDISKIFDALDNLKVLALKKT